MTYALSDVLGAAIVGAIAAITVAALNTWTQRTIRQVAEPIKEKLTTIQVNTDGRLDELINLNLAQRAATVSGIDLSPEVRDHLAAVVGDVVVAPTVHPLIPPAALPVVPESNEETTGERKRNVDEPK